MSEVRISPVEWVAKQAREYEESGGVKGTTVMGVPCLLLDYVGRRSGDWHRTVLMYGRDGADHVIVASNGGKDADPLWYRSIAENPRVRLRVGPERFEADASTVSAGEKAKLWPYLSSVFQGWADYQVKTERDIPVVRLRRV
ncbi:nitroreductase [Actinorhabdospora filicis]|uniref:Nitroreductase n=1 Tax=Actinorhabdospora filicis TaxID=1785913 RepID=A0A9W6SMF6_9ACTN|nr:nitroreductase family deazaflavin-dependent oxidoreductase [Actinorhabdospora filicis]GLZ78918.1 nitroreductase [Actinorhabdospora filicis]